ncbi:MAG: energy-coupling factor transporter transmembrane protein EcfT [Clostridiales bacterium]|jgi:energy-coupling factor transport system permease protein|nr:energy-coupling factor transporter transmembrane protein EcfT [Clostridiales bacterium]
MNVDPRTKLVIVLCLSTLAIFIKDVLFLNGVLLITIIISLIFKTNMLQILRKIKRLLYVLLAIAVIQSVFSAGGRTLIEVGELVILTTVGLQKGLEFVIRIMIIILSATIITTSNSREIVQGLVQWKLPYEIAFMVSIGIRFLPILIEEIKDSVIAIQLRGIEIEKIPLRERFRVYSYLFTPVFVSTIIRAQKLSMSIEMRGFRAYETRTSYTVLEMSYTDYLVIFSSLLCTSALMYLYVS